MCCIGLTAPFAGPARGEGQTAASQPTRATPQGPSLSQAPEVEKQTLDRMLKDASWARRAVAAVRLERYGCQTSRDLLIGLLNDKSWQVRSFAVRSLARRRVPQQETWFADERDPHVLRTALRHRYQLPSDRIDRAVRMLSRSNDLEDRMLAVEIGAAASDQDLTKLSLETTKQIILRMSRSESGSLAPRLALVLKQPTMRRPYDWQHWLLKTGRSMQLYPAFSIDDDAAAVEPSLLASLEPDQFAGLEDYMAKLSQRELDLAICLDCTASMSGEIGAAQGGIDDMMVFVGDVVASVRVGLVAYRDERDEFETKAWEFNSDIAKVRQQLWSLSADGGGDEPEAVYPAMKLACTQLNWRTTADKVLVIVGDAPPHVGYGALCANLAQRGREEAKLTTHCIEAKAKDVKHFPEIAKAGGGRCVSLKDNDLLMAEIAGLSLGDRYQDEFREFFETYLELCR